MAYRSSRGGNTGRRVAPSTSLSSRFQQVHQERQTGGQGQIRKPSRGRPQAHRALNTAASRMDVDQGNQRGRGGFTRRGRGQQNRGQQGRGQQSRGQQGRGQGRGQSSVRGRRGGRGGRGGRNAPRAPLNKDKLDMDLDNYMMTDSKAGRSILDNDLDNYMQNPA